MLLGWYTSKITSFRHKCDESIELQGERHWRLIFYVFFQIHLKQARYFFQAGAFEGLAGSVFSIVVFQSLQYLILVFSYTVSPAPLNVAIDIIISPNTLESIVFKLRFAWLRYCLKLDRGSKIYSVVANGVILSLSI